MNTETMTNQEFFVQETEKAIVSINQVAYQSLIFLESQETLTEFVKQFIDPKNCAIVELGDRKIRFFESLMTPVTLQFDGCGLMPEKKQKLDLKSIEIVGFKEQYLKACAFDSIIILMDKLDSRDPTIIDSI